MVREEGREVFRVTNVEQLSPTCEITPQMELSVESIKDAVGRATVGIRGGLGLGAALFRIARPARTHRQRPVVPSKL